MLIGDLGEEALIEELRSIFAVTSPGIPVTIGDDAAVLKAPPGASEVWTTDLLLEGIHFKSDWMMPEQLGRRCLAVNLSDLASMGAEPAVALLSLACDRQTDSETILGLCRGFRDSALEEGAAVIGGDTSSSTGGLIISVSLGGFLPEGSAVLRSGAKCGDKIYVTGYLGSASGGLSLFQGGVKSGYPHLREAFINPAARVAAGSIARENGATAMTDISDGLSSDMRHICKASGCGAVLSLNSLPVHEELREAAAGFGWDLEDMVLSGGEDYELLYTIPSSAAAGAAEEIMKETGVKVTEIGEILTSKDDISVLNNEGVRLELPARGFDHFKR